MICEFCEGITKQKRVTKHHWYKEKLYIIENVEAEVCTECGERYFHSKILDRIDRLLAEEHDIRQRITVEVVALA